MTKVQEYQALIVDGCPYCGEALQIKRGRYGEFVACSEWCGYTKSIPGRSFFPPKLKKCSFNKCNGSGFLPFVKNGKVIPHARIDCDCKLDEGLNPVSLRGDDFDFACSYTHRAYQAEEYDGVHLPPLEPLTVTPKPAPTIDYFSSGRMVYLQHQVNSLKKGYHTHKKSKRDIV